MNNKRIEFLCGKKKGGKDAKGVKSLDTKQIEQFIKEEAPQNVKNFYSTLQKKNKGRVQLCKVLARFKKGQDLLRSGGTPSPKRKTLPYEQDPMALMAKSNFELMSEIGKVDNRASGNNNASNRGSSGSNRESGDEVYGYNNGNNGGNAAAKAGFRANYARLKRSEPDPFAKELKLKGSNKATIERKIRQLERKGKLPKAATRTNLIKQLTLKTPAQIKALKGPPRRRAKSASKVSSASRAAAKRRIASAGFNARNRPRVSPGQFLKFAKTNVVGPTSRKQTKSTLVLSKSKRYSPSQIRAARREANLIISKLNKTGLLPNKPGRNTPSPNRKERAYNAELAKLKKELLNAQLVTMPPSKGKSPPKPSFSMPTNREAFRKNLATLKAMKAINKTPQNKIIQRILQRINTMNKTFGRRARAAALGEATLNMGSPNNGNSKELSFNKAFSKYSLVADAARARAGGSKKPTRRRSSTPPPTKSKKLPQPMANSIIVNELVTKVAQGKATSAERRKLNVMKAVAKNMGAGVPGSDSRLKTRPVGAGGLKLNSILAGIKAAPTLSKEEFKKLSKSRLFQAATIRDVGRGAKGYYQME